MKFKVILKPSKEGGYTALVPTLPGCISEDDTREETLYNIEEAIELYLEPIEKKDEISENAETVELIL